MEHSEYLKSKAAVPAYERFERLVKAKVILESGRPWGKISFEKLWSIKIEQRLEVYVSWIRK